MGTSNTKHKLSDDLSALDDARKPAKRTRVVKTNKTVKTEETEASQDLPRSTLNTPPKPRAKAKAKKESELDKNGPRYVDVSNGMLRPPGEKRPARIWDVPKKRHNFNIVQVAKGWPNPVIVKTKRLRPGDEETRAVEFVHESSEWYHTALDRASTERMYLLERTRSMEQDCHAGQQDCPTETIHIAGQSGNLYTVYISHRPTCTCPDARFRRRACKHISYVLHHVLKAPPHLCYQDALLTSELRAIADAAPAIPEAATTTPVEQEPESIRKPVEDDCPICCMEFEQEEEVIWCQSSCGNNIHKSCFEQWFMIQTKQQRVVTCPFCRAAWAPAKTSSLSGPQTLSSGSISLPAFTINGYLNVGDQLSYD